MAAARMAASGLATPVPAMSGADPWTGSYRPGGRPPRRRRGQHPQRAGEHRCLVGEDVTEQVAGDHHVEVGGPGQQVHRHGVHQDDVVVEVRILGGDDLGGDPPPQPGHLEHVRLVYRRQPAPPGAGGVGRHPDDPLDLAGRVHHRGEGLGPVGTHPGRPEVDPAGQLAHEQDIHSGHLLRSQRRRRHQLRMHLHRSQVGVQPELGTQRQQPGLWAGRRGRVVPAGTTDGPQKHGVGSPARLECLRRERLAVVVDGIAPDGPDVEREPVTPCRRHRLQHPARPRPPLRGRCHRRGAGRG